MRVTRGQRVWQFGVRADGELPLDGALPHVMDWGAQGPAGPKLPDLGCRLLSLVTLVPDPEAAQRRWHALDVEGAPELRQGGPHACLVAIIETPAGIRVLT
jgi:hypothetical protein